MKGWGIKEDMLMMQTKKVLYQLPQIFVFDCVFFIANFLSFQIWMVLSDAENIPTISVYPAKRRFE